MLGEFWSSTEGGIHPELERAYAPPAHGIFIHIQAPVSEWHGRLVLDLPLDDSSSGAVGGLGIEYWSKLLDSFDRRPVFILDPPRPPDPLEVARQVMFRNSFAADLVVVGRLRSVLCIGLFEPSAVELMAERLAYEISRNPPFRQIISLFHKELGGDHFCTTGAALYVANPEDSLR